MSPEGVTSGGHWRPIFDSFVPSWGDIPGGNLLVG